MKALNPIKKNFGYRVIELSQSLMVIRDSISMIKNGQTHQIIPLSGQLRALFMEKHKGNKPLLLTIAKELKHELNFYSMEKADVPVDGLMLQMSGFPLSLERELPGQQLIKIENFINGETISFGGNPYSMKDVIGFYANIAGGAHYSADLPQDMADLLSLTFGGQAPLIAIALVQFGEIAYKLGHRLLKKVIDMDLHLLLMIPEKVESIAYVIDLKHASSSMRLSLKVRPSIQLIFEMQGLAGNYAVVHIERAFDWKKPHHIKLSVETDESLNTILAVFVDGDYVARSTFPQLIIILNDPSIYNLYINRSADIPDSGLEMACANFAIYNADQSNLDKARTLVAFGEILLGEEIPCTYFRKTGHAYLSPGQHKLEYVGEYSQWDMKKLSNGDKP